MRTEIWRDGRGRTWRVLVPETRRERARGLRGRPELASDEMLFLPRCRSVHTFGMRFRIDVASLDAELRVRRVTQMRPRRFLLPRRSTRHIVEMPADAGVRPGSRFQMSRERIAELAR